MQTDVQNVQNVTRRLKSGQLGYRTCTKHIVTSDCQGLAKPLGLEGRVQRVRVRVGISVPLTRVQGFQYPLLAKKIKLNISAKELFLGF